MAVRGFKISCWCSFLSIQAPEIKFEEQQTFEVLRFKTEPLGAG